MEKIQKFFINKLVLVNKDFFDATVENICPVCQYLARDKEDLLSIEKEKSCTECFLNFKFEMKEKWENGERPSIEVARSRMNIVIKEVQNERT